MAIVCGSVNDLIFSERVVCSSGLIVSFFQAELHVILSGLKWVCDYIDDLHNAGVKSNANLCWCAFEIVLWFASVVDCGMC